MKRTSFLADIVYYHKLNENYTMKKTVHYKSSVIHLPTKNVVYSIAKNFEKQNQKLRRKSVKQSRNPLRMELSMKNI